MKRTVQKWFKVSCMSEYIMIDKLKKSLRTLIAKRKNESIRMTALKLLNAGIEPAITQPLETNGDQELICI